MGIQMFYRIQVWIWLWLAEFAVYTFWDRRLLAKSNGATLIVKVNGASLVALSGLISQLGCGTQSFGAFEKV